MLGAICTSALVSAVDRLDSERVLVLVYIVDDPTPQRNAEALRKIAFARRSSFTSLRNSTSCVASLVVVPGRDPSSTSAWVTQPRSVSMLIPS